MQSGTHRSCSFHNHISEDLYVGRQWSRGNSHKECRVPQLCELHSAFKWKFPQGIVFEHSGGELVNRCAECLWEASVMRGKRSSDESKASGFLPCSNCSGVVLHDAFLTHVNFDSKLMPIITTAHMASKPELGEEVDAC